jgi:hypothetical protein
MPENDFCTPMQGGSGTRPGHVDPRFDGADAPGEGPCEDKAEYGYEDDPEVIRAYAEGLCESAQREDKEEGGSCQGTGAILGQPYRPSALDIRMFCVGRIVELYAGRGLDPSLIVKYAGCLADFVENGAPESKA